MFSLPIGEPILSEKKLDEELEKELMGGDDDEFSFESATADTSAPQDDIAESLSRQLEGEQVTAAYKYLQLAITQISDIEYDVIIKDQSHGFLNYFVSKILQCKGVDFAAYKNQSISDPVIYIRIDGTLPIKSILQEALKYARTEWKGMRNAVNAMKI